MTPSRDCQACAERIAAVMDERPADMLEEMLRRTRILGNAARAAIAASERAGSLPGPVAVAIRDLSRALDEANAFRNRTPAECVVSTYLKLVRPDRMASKPNGTGRISQNSGTDGR